MNKNNNGRGAEMSRRADLLCAAARLMRKKGYAATTIREIAREVGMGSGSPFCHFRSKEEILAAVAVHGMEHALHQAEEVHARRMSAHRRLRALLCLHAEMLHGEESDYTAVLLREWRALAPASRRRIRALAERYEAIWRDCLQKLHGAKATTDETRLTARLLLGCLNWSLYWFKCDGPLKHEHLADAASCLLNLVSPSGNGVAVTPARAPPPRCRAHDIRAHQN